MADRPMDPALLETAVQVARAAGAELMRWYGGPLRTARKDGGEVVTEADLSAEQLIIEQLSRRFPSHTFVAEEGTRGGQEDLTAADREWVWYIDPLDGTANFARRDPHFAVSVGLVRQGKPCLGVVYNPARDRLFSAAPGIPGGEARLDGQLIAPLPPAQELSEAVVATDWPWAAAQRQYTAAFLHRVYPHVRQLKIRGSAASDLCDLALGALDAYFHPALCPWDVAAASVIATAAGRALFTGRGNWIFVPARPQPIAASAPSLAEPLRHIVAEILR